MTKTKRKKRKERAKSGTSRGNQFSPSRPVTSEGSRSGKPVSTSKTASTSANIPSPGSFDFSAAVDLVDPKLLQHLDLNPSDISEAIKACMGTLQSFWDSIPGLDSKVRPTGSWHLKDKSILELMAFAFAQQCRAKSLKPGSEPEPISLAEKDPRCTFWEVGWWDKAWSSPDCKQEWHGDPDLCWGYLTLELAIEMLSKQGLIQPSQYEEIKSVCLTEAEYWHGDEHQAGWSITRAESQPYLSDPNAPLWVLIDYGPSLSFPQDMDETFASAILEPFRVDWLEWHGKVLHRYKTLDEILREVRPDLSWQDLEYQKIWIERINADGFESLPFRSKSNHCLQLSREQSLQEAGIEFPYIP